MRAYAGRLDKGEEEEDLERIMTDVDERTALLQGKGAGTLYGIKKRLYVSHFLSTWNSRAFEYGAVLFLAEIYPNTFTPMSLYALFGLLSAIFFAHKVGEFVDKSERLVAARFSIVQQRLAVVVSCALLGLMIVVRHSEGDGESGLGPGVGDRLGRLLKEYWPGLCNEWTLHVCLGLLIVFACVERLCSVMNLLVVERDWVVVISESVQDMDDNEGDNENESAHDDGWHHHQEEVLRELNSQMRRIDLTCKLVGPLAISFVDSYLTVFSSVCSVLVFNLVSVFIEYGTIAKVYEAVPNLKHKRHLEIAASDLENEVEGSTAPPVSTTSNIIPSSTSSFLSQIKLYCNHQMFLPSFSLSILYLTVLSFGPQMVAFLLFQGFDPALVGILRGISTCLEISVTSVAPFLMKRIGVIRSGLWFINLQVICLIAALLLSWHYLNSMSDNSNLSPSSAFYGTMPLVIGVILSRFGLWGFDLSVQVQIQQAVEPHNRAKFSAIESSFQNLFNLLAYLATILWSHPNQFKYPTIISVAAVTSASLLYLKYVHRERKHIFHFEKLYSLYALAREWL